MLAPRAVESAGQVDVAMVGGTAPEAHASAAEEPTAQRVREDGGQGGEKQEGQDAPQHTTQARQASFFVPGARAPSIHARSASSDARTASGAVPPGAALARTASAGSKSASSPAATPADTSGRPSCAGSCGRRCACGAAAATTPTAPWAFRDGIP